MRLILISWNISKESGGGSNLLEINEPIEQSSPSRPCNNDEVILEGDAIKPKGGWLYLFTKRTFDVVSSFLALFVFGWFILILMLIKWIEDLGVKSYKLDIKEDSNGKYIAKDGKRYSCILVKDPNGEKDPTCHGAIYTSLRVGKNGKIFKFHKIRSMCPGAEKMKEQLLSYSINEADAPAFKLKDDPRITKFGKFLRKSSLDELPQIWDIFVGNMSVVGPRPPIPQEVEEYAPYERHRLDVKGGLLCLWQIQPNKNDLSFKEWCDLDIKYVTTRSALLDLKIIFKGAIYILIGGVITCNSFPIKKSLSVVYGGYAT